MQTKIVRTKFRVEIELCEDHHYLPTPIVRDGDCEKVVRSLRELESKVRTFVDNYLGEYNTIVSSTFNAEEQCPHCGCAKDRAINYQTKQWECCDKALEETAPQLADRKGES